MAFPALTKTWQFTVNQTLAVSASAAIHQQRSINQIVKMMQGAALNPWVAITSSNAGIVGGVNYGGTGSGDLWVIDNATLAQAAGVITVPNDVNYNTNRHSWIVLRQTGIASNFEVCFDLSSVTPGSMTIAFSPSAGFTGGTATARPTATDEIRIVGGSSAASVFSNVNTQRVFHYMQSTDGQCSRLWVWRSGTINEVCLLFEMPKNPVSGCPALVFAESIVTGSDATVTSSVTNFYVGRRFRGRVSSDTVLLAGLTAEAYSNGTLLRSATGIGSAVNTFSGEWPVLPLGVATNATATTDGGSSGSQPTVPPPFGRIANLHDMWWRPSGLATGDSFPNNPATRQFMSIGDIVVPWVGDATALTTT